MDTAMEHVKVKDEPGLESGSAAFARGGEASTSGMEEDGDSIVREIDVFVKPQLDGSTQVRLKRKSILMENVLSHAQVQRARSGKEHNGSTYQKSEVANVPPEDRLGMLTYHQKESFVRFCFCSDENIRLFPLVQSLLLLTP
jgi:hypothetical protein